MCKQTTTQGNGGSSCDECFNGTSLDAHVRLLVEQHGFSAVHESLQKQQVSPSTSSNSNSNSNSSSDLILEQQPQQQQQPQDSSDESSVTTSGALLPLVATLLETCEDAILVTDAQGRIQVSNPAAQTLFGLPPEQDEHEINLKSLLGPDILREEQVLENAFGVPYWNYETTTTTTTTTPRQENIPLRVQTRCLSSQQRQQQHCWLVICQDLTESCRARTLACELQSIFDSSFDGILVLDETATIRQVNPALLRILGYDTDANLVQQPMEYLFQKKEEEQQQQQQPQSPQRSNKKHPPSCCPIHSLLQDFLKHDDQSSTVLGAGRKHHLLACRSNGTYFPCRIGLQKVPGQNLIVAFIHDSTTETRAMELALEKRAAQDLLYNMLPREIAHRLQSDPHRHLADHFANASILFADIVGFTKLSNSLQPAQVVHFLNSIFSKFDTLLDKYGLNKVKTIGDCYMVTSIPGCTNAPKSCAAVCHFAMDMIAALQEYNQEHADDNMPLLNMRIGINTGPVVAGVVGTKRFLYDIWGDAVNVASRMESTGVSGKVQVTQAVIDAVVEAGSSSEINITETAEFVFEERGPVQVKGIGEMKTYFIQHRDESRAKKHWNKLRATYKSVVSNNRAARAPMNRRKTMSIMELLDSVQHLQDLDDDDYSDTDEEEYKSDDGVSL